MAPLLSLFLLFLTISPSSSSRTLPLDGDSTPAAPGPIKTHGRNYTYACDPDRFTALSLDIKQFGYCNKNLSYYDRVDDLVGRLVLDEKVHMISDYAHGVDRIGLPEYKWWSEILHGVSSVGQGGQGEVGHATWFGDDVPGATQFPEVILSAASFNESLYLNLSPIAPRNVVVLQGRKKSSDTSLFTPFCSHPSHRASF